MKSLLISGLGVGGTVSNNKSLIDRTLNPNLNVRRPFFELTIKVNWLQIGIAIGLNGLLVAVRRFDQRLIIAVGKWGNRR
jgi:hypothetical protein